MERDHAQIALLRCEAEIKQACERNETVGRLINPTVRTNVMDHLDQLSLVLTTTQEKLKESEQRFRESEEARAEISRSVEGFLHLRDQRRHEHQDETARQLQIDLDEVVMRQWSYSDIGDALPSAGFSE